MPQTSPMNWSIVFVTISITMITTKSNINTQRSNSNINSFTQQNTINWNW